MRLTFLLLTAWLLLSTAARAQTAPTAPPTETTPAAALPPKDPRDKPSLIPAPVLFYEPETGVAVGATFLPVWRFGRDSSTTRKSNGRLGGWVSQKKQINLQLAHNIFTPGEKWLISGDLNYFDYPIFFYGIGNDTRTADESEISYNLIVFNQRVFKGVRRHLFAGLSYRLTDTRNIQADKPTVNDGDRPNLLLDPSIVPREQLENTRTSGIGPAVVYDSRDNVLSTFAGNYVDVQVLFNTETLGSDYGFTRYQLDARRFQPLFGNNNTILAVQALGQFNSANIPFRELANLGGVNVLRGIYEGRFRDRQLIVGQAELRRHLFWRINGAVFAGAGQVANQPKGFGFDRFNFAGGAGVRFQFNRRDRLNVRFDYGVGSGKSSGLYFGVGEAF